MHTSSSTTGLTGSEIRCSLRYGNKLGALRPSAVDSIRAGKFQLSTSIGSQLLDCEVCLDGRDINRLAVTCWWEKAFVLGNTQEKGLEARLAIYIAAYQTHSGVRMNGFSTDTTFYIELGQVLKDNFVAESVIGRWARNGAIGSVAESRSFCSSQDMVPVNRLRSEARNPRQIGDILEWQIFIYIQA